MVSDLTLEEERAFFPVRSTQAKNPTHCNTITLSFSHKHQN